jgi:hypothetical protein
MAKRRHRMPTFMFLGSELTVGLFRRRVTHQIIWDLASGHTLNENGTSLAFGSKGTTGQIVISTTFDASLQEPDLMAPFDHQDSPTGFIGITVSRSTHQPLLPTIYLARL